MYTNKKLDIIFRKNIRFKDTGALDLCLRGHPTLNITDPIDGKMYFLLITSNKIDSKRYYKLKPTKRNKLKNISYVDLDYVYCEDYKNHIPYSKITENEYKEIIKLVKIKQP